MTLRGLQVRVGFVLVSLQVGVNELNKTVEVLGCDSFVLLVEVINVAVEDLDEEFDGHGGVHASVGDSESPLKAFKDALAVTVELQVLLDSRSSRNRKRLKWRWLRTF